jgi:hypothetical protein
LLVLLLLLLLQVMKLIAFSFNGVQPIDSNSTFTADALAAAPGKKFITLCEAGGTMKPTVNFPLVSENFIPEQCGCLLVFAWQAQLFYARSLEVGYRGATNLPAGDVVHLQRGMLAVTNRCLLLRMSRSWSCGGAFRSAHQSLCLVLAVMQGKPSRSLQAACMWVNVDQ